MDVKLPNLGEGADSGVVVSILVKDGESVEEGQTLLELENEKAVAPIPAPASGAVARIRVKPGDKVTVGQTLLSIESGKAPSAPDDAPAAAAPEQARAKAQSRPAPREPVDEDEPELDEEDAAPVNVAVAAAPSIRKLAADLGIDLTRVRGSERGGRIVLADVRAYIERLQKPASRPRTARSGAAAAQPAAPVESIDFAQWGPVSKKPLSPLRKVISRRMLESWNQVPRVTQFDEADITALNALRKKHQQACEAKGVRLTLTPLVLKAVVATLQKHPVFNSSVDEASGELVTKEYFHIGMAVDTDAGLLVPVIRDVDKKGLADLARELEDLAAKARDRKLSGEDMKGGTFTVSNQGAIGGGHFTPIVNVPEVAILGLGRGALKAVVRDQQIVPRLMLPIAVSYDHRVIDGGTAARFTVDLVKALEEFDEGRMGL